MHIHIRVNDTVNAHEVGQLNIKNEITNNLNKKNKFKSNT